jgi:L-ascorbate metabolism protein UlaG (beta-lactamase superfamily)
MKALGKLPGGAMLDRLRESPQYRNGAFRNVEETTVMKKDVSYFSALLEFTKRSPHVEPPGPLPVQKSDLSLPVSEGCHVTWFGHSSYYLQIAGLNILVDPVFGYASPLPIFGHPFRYTEDFTVEELPVPDVLVITHDHYDHLEYETLLALRSRVKRVVVPPGVSSHLVYWGYAMEQITELDWWQCTLIKEGVQLTATPARHFSGRAFKRNQTLWSSYVLEAGKTRVFIGGDSGYDRQFSEIGGRFGSFDLSILECGQYGKNWPQIHMVPEETSAAAFDLNSRVLLPVHWGKYNLSVHSWDEPVNRLVDAVSGTGLQLLTPKPGQRVSLTEAGALPQWWKEIC